VIVTERALDCATVTSVSAVCLSACLPACLPACRADSFTLSNARVERLTQGTMVVADVTCARCRRAVGWKFIRCVRVRVCVRACVRVCMCVDARLATAGWLREHVSSGSTNSVGWAHISHVPSRCSIDRPSPLARHTR
jgi:hypothetical protein